MSLVHGQRAAARDRVSPAAAAGAAPVHDRSTLAAAASFIADLDDFRIVAIATPVRPLRLMRRDRSR